MSLNSFRSVHHDVCRCYVRGMLAMAAMMMSPSTAQAGGLVRVSDGQQQYEGQVVALSKTQCAMIDRQGQLLRLNVAKLRDFKKIADRFQAQPSNEFRDELRREFSGDYEVAGTTHYLVCAPRGRGKRYGDLFESIYRDVEHFYRVHDFPIHTPDVPLVAVVFATQQEFVNYCVKDKVPPSQGLMGYYSLKTNRVVLFDDDRLLSAATGVSGPVSFPVLTSAVASTGISGETTNTIIHETTHQVGYNIGIHSRLGGTPLWVVEGLATVLEPDGMRHRNGRRQNDDRLNGERYRWFTAVHRPQRQMGSLAKLIASDPWFHHKTLNSYSEAWAFCYFLLDNSSRRRSLVNYLQQLSLRDATQTYTARQRLIDFQDVFGDISRLEIEFIRYMDRI